MKQDNFLLTMIKKSLGLPTGDSHCCGGQVALPASDPVTSVQPESPDPYENADNGLGLPEEEPESRDISAE